MQTEPSSRDKSRLSTNIAKGAFAIAALLVSTGATGCGAGRDLKGSMTAYERGNFHKAEQRCEEMDESGLDGKAQVRYFVYCGLAYYKVGRPEARELLANGQKLYTDGDPAWLKPLIVDEMQKALTNLASVPVPPRMSTPVASVMPATRKRASESDDQYE